MFVVEIRPSTCPFFSAYDQTFLNQTNEEKTTTLLYRCRYTAREYKTSSLREPKRSYYQKIHFELSHLIQMPALGVESAMRPMKTSTYPYGQEALTNSTRVDIRLFH